MAKARTLVGLDVHATTIVAAVLDAETAELRTFRMSGEGEQAAAFCAGLPSPVRVAHEAGPTGYEQQLAGEVAIEPPGARLALTHGFEGGTARGRRPGGPAFGGG